jgi:hypothetical protein
VLKRETLPPVVPGAADQALQVPPPPPPPGMPPFVEVGVPAAAAPIPAALPEQAAPDVVAANETPVAAESAVAAAPAPPPVAPAAGPSVSRAQPAPPVQAKAPEMESASRPVKVLGRIDLRKLDTGRPPPRAPVEARRRGPGPRPRLRRTQRPVRPRAMQGGRPRSERKSFARRASSRSSSGAIAPAAESGRRSAGRCQARSRKRRRSPSPRPANAWSKFRRWSPSATSRRRWV